ncbi:MAG TPA: type II secretion system protein GspL [Gammaproteobacteria bacterium]|nr:type II secretion system protein GspL [Gammaproteobacteria bacterium]
MKLKLAKLWNRAQYFYITKILPPPQQNLQNKVLIFLPTASTTTASLRADWLIANAEGAPLQTVIDGELLQFSPAEEDEILVIVPTHSMLLTQATLPPLSAYRLQQALPYALEEQVLDELDELHFAPGSYQSQTGHLPVAIVKKTQLEQWQKMLQNQGIQANQLIPAVFTLPYEENKWQVLIEENTATVRTGLYTGFCSELENLETLLTLKLGEEEQVPEKLIIYHAKKEHFHFSSLTLPSDTSILSPKQRLCLAAAALNQGPTLNILQGAYASTRKHRMPEKNKRVFRLAALIFSLWLGLIGVSKITSLLILTIGHHHLQNLITATYQTHFPQEKLGFDPKAQFAAKLKKALGESEKNRLFQLLGYLARSASSIRIQSLTFQNNQLNLELLASSFASLDNFILSLKAQGIAVKQQNTSLANNQVKAVLFIEGKTA